MKKALRFIFSLFVVAPGIVIGVLIVPIVFPVRIAWDACDIIMRWLETEYK